MPDVMARAATFPSRYSPCKKPNGKLISRAVHFQYDVSRSRIKDDLFAPQSQGHSGTPGGNGFEYEPTVTGFAAKAMISLMRRRASRSESKGTGGAGVALSFYQDLD